MNWLEEFVNSAQLAVKLIKQKRGVDLFSGLPLQVDLFTRLSQKIPKVIDFRNFLSKPTGLVYHHRTECGAYHQARHGVIL